MAFCLPSLTTEEVFKGIPYMSAASSGLWANYLYTHSFDCSDSTGAFFPPCGFIMQSIRQFFWKQFYFLYLLRQEIVVLKRQSLLSLYCVFP